MRRAICRVLRAAGVAAMAAAGACCSTPRADTTPDVPPPAYSALREGYNARTALLGRVWGRAVVSLRWTEEDGDGRYEQGDGHLQVIQPDRFALSVGKLGEVLYWMGSSGDRYWLIDRNDGKVAHVGTGDALAALEGSPMPAGPRELMVLLGIAPLPEAGVVDVVWADDRAVVVEPRAPGLARYRYEIDSGTFLPRKITLLDGEGGDLITSALETYDRVDVRDVPLGPQMATRIRIIHLPSETEVLMSLEMLRDKSRMGEIDPESFDFERLVDRLGPVEVRDLDETLRDEG